jgi:hypothetical protein
MKLLGLGTTALVAATLLQWCASGGAWTWGDEKIALCRDLSL